MTKILIWSFIAYGLTNIVVFSKIIAPFRNFLFILGNITIPKDIPIVGRNTLMGGFLKIFRILLMTLKRIGKFLHELFTCPMCFSVWGGAFLSLVLFSPTNTILNINESYCFFFDGLFSSGIVYLINSFVEWLEENRINLKNGTNNII